MQAGLKLNGGAELKTLADKGGVLRRAGGAGAGTGSGPERPGGTQGDRARQEEVMAELRLEWTAP